MKKLMLILFMLPLAVRLFAPAERVIYITREEGINPFIPACEAVRLVETGIHPDTINYLEGAYGPRQIRQGKLTDFNKATGEKYTLSDCLQESVSREIFLWHCLAYRDVETAVKRWNGSGKKTEEYWEKVKVKLTDILFTLKQTDYESRRKEM